MVVRALAVLLALTGLFLSTNGARAELYWSRDFDSAALGAKMKYSIYLPSGYHAPKQQKQRHPTVYLLHGVGDNERAWPSWGGVEATLDQMIASKALSPMIVVMLASKRSWYVDSADIGGPGNYATAVRDDLRAHIKKRYCARTDRGGRAIAGLSMGGFGAMRLAFERPEIYRAVGAMSSAL